MSSEKFCLRWNDFERNISSAFKDIREEKEFFDITIACEDEQLQAHKVILSACSPFFKKVLYRNHHQHPLLYLKGVSFKDMEAVLNFMYHGEVNVAQDDLNSFLQVAEDLRVKGLTQNNGGNIGTEPKKPNSVDIPKHEPSVPRPRDSAPPINRPRPTPPPPPPRQPIPQRDDDIQEIMPVVKSEPSHLVEAPIQPLAQQGLPMYDERTQQVESNMMMSMDTEQYDDSYGDYEGHYGDNGQGYEGDMGGVGQEGVGTGDRAECSYCGKWLHKRGLKRHIQDVHNNSGTKPEFICDVCNKTFKSNQYLKNHLRLAHSIYQQHNL